MTVCKQLTVIVETIVALTAILENAVLDIGFSVCAMLTMQDRRCCLRMTLNLSGWLGLLLLAAVTRLPRRHNWIEPTAMAPQPSPALPALHSLLAGGPAHLRVGQA